MFERLGRFAARYRWPIIGAWVAAAVLVTLIAPNLDHVASSDTSDFLPEDAPFNQGYERLSANFDGAESDGAVVIAIEAPGGNVREGDAWTFIVDLTDWLNNEAPGNISNVTSPGIDVPLIADSLIAANNELAMITFGFEASVLDDSTASLLDTIREYINAHTPDGVNAYLTGNSPIYSGYANSALESIDRTLFVTIALVIILLLFVYRSPVSPLVPLITVTLVYLIARGIVAWLGTWFFTVIIYANVMLVVVLYGAGTDYCLFLISRFREEMADTDDVSKATVSTLHRVGETITSSAGTVIVGFVAMSFAEMGLFNTTGPALAIGVVLMLLAGLTLTPAILAVMGNRAFWPGKATHKADSRLYEWVSTRVSEHPLQAIVVLTLILAPLAAYGAGLQTTYNMLADLPDTNEAQQGFQAIEEHIGAGQVQSISVVIDELDPDTALAEIAGWTDTLLAVDSVAEVRSMSSPLGQGNAMLTNITSVAQQLTLAADLLAEFNSDESDALPAEAMTQENIQLALGLLPAVGEYLDAVEALDPSLADDADLAAIRETVSGLPLAALSGGIPDALAALEASLSGLAATVSELDNAYYFPTELPEAVNNALTGSVDVAALGMGDNLLDALTGRYVTDDRTAARFEVIMAVNPYADEATDVVRELRDVLPGGPAAISGLPAVMTDLRDTMERDMFRSFSLVLVGIFVVLLLLLRAFVSPIYLILTILLSYGATMGITRLFSVLVFGTTALTWWTPFFIFVMLIALGMDYNIFLMGRVKEEAARHGMREGVHRAVAATGPIITSAGLIMAGTFAAMMAGTVTGLKQLGFAVAVGVLLDTFIIRTALVPAIAVLLDRWNWWPGKAPQVAPDIDAAATVPGD
jgi:RND superfamily putative drug exporter